MPDEYDENRTLGPHFGAIATLAGFPPDPEQQFCLNVSCALDKKGHPLTSRNVIIAPRQNLKTGFEKQRKLGSLFVLQLPLSIWSAHEFDTAQEALNDIEALIDGCDDLKRKVQLTSRGNVAKRGAVPEIKLLPKFGNARLKFKTRTGGSGRGLTGDSVAVDEAFAAKVEQMGAMMPTMLARPDSQVDFLSSACKPESAYLWNLIQWCRAGADGRTFYIEWCAPPPEEVCDLGAECTHGVDAVGCGSDKPEVIILAHPAVTRGRITLQKIRDSRIDLREEYPREIMGWHDEPDEDVLAVNYQKWAAGLSEKAAAESAGAFCIEVSMDRSWTSISVAGPSIIEGKTHVELVERRRGTGWSVERCKELDRDHNRPIFVVDGGGPAASLIPDLEDAGLWVVTADTADAADAYALLVDALDQDELSHGPQDVVDQAVLIAQKRPLGDGKNALARRASGGADITPFVSEAFAHWAYQKYGGDGLGPGDIYVGGV